MSFRDHASNIMDNLIASGIWSAAIVLAVKFWPRIVATFTALRVAISSLSAALLRRLRALLPARAKVGQLTGRSIAVSQSYGAMHDATPEPMQHVFAGPQDHHMQTPHAAVFSASTARRGYNVVMDSRYPDRAPEITQNNTLMLQRAIDPNLQFFFDPTT